MKINRTLLFESDRFKSMSKIHSFPILSLCTVANKKYFLRIRKMTKRKKILSWINKYECSVRLFLFTLIHLIGY